MLKHTSLEWPLLMASIPGILFSSVAILVPGMDVSVHDARARSESADTLSKSVETPERAPLPVRVLIPSIGVDAAIERVGLNAEGNMEAPALLDEVAWFVPGARPGETGSAVMAGHYGRKDNTGSVFDSLHLLRAGDIVITLDETGASLSFVVRETRRYDADADAVEVFSSDDGGVHLNLITCEGAWYSVIGGFPERRVVFTDLAE
jgi:sortase A